MHQLEDEGRKRKETREHSSAEEVQMQSWRGKRKSEASSEGMMNGNSVNIRVRQVEYAKYGVVEGSMLVRGRGPSNTCMVVSKGWPSWAFGAMGVGLDLRYILLLSGEWEETLARMYPEVVVINCGASNEGCGVRMVELDKVDVCFSDVDPPGRLNIWELAGCSVITSRRCRRVPKGWNEEVSGVCHTDCGGVTDFRGHVHVYTRDLNNMHLPFQPVTISGKRDLSSILDSRARHGTPCQPPGEVRLGELAVREVPGGRGAYHGGGWLPWGERSLRVITPNEFSQTKWCKRKLSDEEWLQVLDVPVSVIKGLSQSEKTKVVADASVLPVKVLTGVCQRFVGRSSVNAVTVYESESQGEDEMTRVEVDHLDRPLVQEHMEEDRMAKATKSDDAAVPEYLWDDRLLAGLGMEKTEVVLQALTALRTLFVRWWKRKVTTSLFRWWLAIREEFNGRVEAHRLVAFDGAKGCYKWRVKGKKQYKVERNARRARDRGIASDAVDAVRRSANSSWWE